MADTEPNKEPSPIYMVEAGNCSKSHNGIVFLGTLDSSPRNNSLLLSAVEEGRAIGTAETNEAQ